jgi:ribosomal protein L37AE/L43A
MPRIAKKQTIRQTGTQMLDCMFCRTPTKTDMDTSAILCGNCTARLADPAVRPSPTVNPTEAYAARQERKQQRVEARKQAQARKSNAVKGRGRGWHLKRVFEWEGQFYSFGELITPARAQELIKS